MKAKYKFNPALQFIKDDVQGNAFVNGQFIAQNGKEKLPYQRLVKWITTANPQRKEKKNDNYTPEVIKNTDFLFTQENTITWLGHSSFYIQLNGLKILTDPVYHHLTPLLKRKHALPCPIDTFTKINYILLSHGHRDHLDIPTLKILLKNNPYVTLLCPLGFEKMLRNIGFKNIQEAAWWQQYNTPELTIDFLPAKHWNRRFIWDYNTTLWGSFSIQNKETSIYFSGDTGFSPHFTEIKEQFNSFDVCLMPIGAYKPRYIMEWAHISPQEAVEAFHLLNGKTFIPMHYGTFDLSDEPASEPLQLLQEFQNQQKINGDLKILKVGEIYTV
jgi:L-ascorbate metabolism protein UlaG (beta-lactamase superfamily)